MLIFVYLVRGVIGGGTMEEMMNRREFAALAGGGVAGFLFPHKSHSESSFPDVHDASLPGPGIPNFVTPEGMARLISEFPQGPESLLFYGDEICHRSLIPPPAGCFAGRHISIELHECLEGPTHLRSERFPNSTWSVTDGTTLHVESPGFQSRRTPGLIRWVADIDHIDTVRFKRVNQPMVSYRNLGEGPLGPACHFWHRVIDGRYDRTVYQSGNSISAKNSEKSAGREKA